MEKRIQKIRKFTSLSQEDFAKEIGIAFRAYTSYERGNRKPSFEYLNIVFVKYNINLNWLITGEGEMFNVPKYDDVKDDLKSQVEAILKEKGLI